MSMTCDDLDSLLPEFMDGELTAEQEHAAAEHVATCRECRIEIDQLQRVGELYRQGGQLTLSPEAKARIASALGIENG